VSYRDFSDYEARSIFHTEVRAPFSEPALRVLGHLNSARRYLIRRYTDLQQVSRVSFILTTSVGTHCRDAVVDSVLAQTYRNIELLVCGETATRDPRLRQVQVLDGASRAGARNACLREATGDYVTWLDGTSTLDPEFVRVMLGTLKEQANTNAVYCAQRKEDSGGRLLALRYTCFNRALLENHPYLDLNCVLHARGLIDWGAPFDEHVDEQQNDWLFLLKLTEGSAMRVVPCALVTNPAADAVTGDGCDSLTDGGVLGERPCAGQGAAVDAWLAVEPLIDRLSDVAVPGLERMFALRRRQQATQVRPVSIVIPSYECAEHLRLCIAAVRAFTDASYELIVVDNASSAPVGKVLDRLASEDGVRVIRNARNAGFTHAVNQGIADSAPRNDVVLLNNDAVVTPGWLAALQSALEQVPTAGAIVPRQVLLAGTDTVAVHQPACDLRREMDVNLSAHHDNILDPALVPSTGLVELSFAPFFCVYLERSVIDALGPLDEDGAPHYRSDRLYCEALRRLLGRKVVYTPHAKVYHFLQRATQALAARSPPEYDALFVRNVRP
jgi:O-antigen biosynthesis protein